MPSAASLRGARLPDRELMGVRFDKDDDEDGAERLGALVVDVTEERVTEGTVIFVAFNVSFPENGTMPGEEAHYVTMLALSRGNARAFQAGCGVFENATVAEKCLDAKEEIFFWEAEIKAPNSTATTTAGGGSKNSGKGDYVLYRWVIGGDKKSYYDKDDKENDVKVVPNPDGSARADMHIKRDVQGLSLLLLNNGIKSVNITDLRVGPYNVTAPGASLIIPASKVPTTTNTTTSNSTTTTIISNGGGTISPRPPNTTVAIGPSGAVNITTSSANGTITTTAGPGAVVALPGVMNVTVTNVTYPQPN